MDGRVHHQVLSSFVQRGYAPDVAELAVALAAPAHAIEQSLTRLHAGHGLVLHPGSHDIWLAHPFSSSPTAVWVAAGERGWWAPCMWCAAGVVALAAPSATVHARCAGEHESLTIEVRNGQSQAQDLLVHFAIPPRDAWSNVSHWCSTVLPFRNARDVDTWSQRHRLPRGALLPWSQVLALGAAWYGRHLDQDWRKWSLREAQEIFERAGLRGAFWQLPLSEQPF
jgi:Alkylmercury lyase